MNACPTPHQLRMWLAGRLGDADAGEIEAHVESCPDVCQPLLDSLAENEHPSQAGDARPSPAKGEADTLAYLDRPADAPKIPRKFGRFEIIALLGRGGFGDVYRALDPELGREVALKIPRKGALQGDEERERFRREAKAAATLQHPNICQIHDAGEVEGRQYIVMALVDGQSLGKVIARGRPIPERNAAAMARKLALALEEAHRKGIVHRDLKPGNIMLDGRGQPIVMDFGLARRVDVEAAQLTRTGAIMGTPAYMAPEQALARHDEIGPATDIYALGAVLYELLTTRPPFEGDTAAVLARIAREEPKPPSALRPRLDPRLEAICLKAIAKRPADRFGSMLEFAEALREFLRPPEAERPTGLAALDSPEFAGLVSGLNTQLATIAKRQSVPWWKWTAAGAGFVALVLLGWFIVPRGPLIVTNIGVDARLLVDESLSFFLDGREITAQQAREPMELAAGDHELLVKRQELVVKHYRFHVSPPSKSAATAEAVAQQVELMEVKQVAVVKVPPPAGHWDFEAPGDSNVPGDGLTATAPKPGVRRRSGVRGQAAAFSGLGDAYTAHGAPALQGNAALTIAAWVLPNSDRPGRVAGKWSEKGSYELSWADGVYSFRVAFPVGGPTGTPVGVQALGSTGEWAHLVGVFDGKSIALYVDGRLFASQEIARSERLRRTADFAKSGKVPTALQDTAAPFRCGGDGFQGLIDEVELWDSALSPEQVAMAFETYGAPPAPAAAVAAADAHRRIAEWVITRGGSIVVAYPDRPYLHCRSIDDLPAEPFKIYMSGLFDDLLPSDEDLARLDEVPDLKGISISNSPGYEGQLTEEGILHFLRNHPFLTEIFLGAQNGGLSMTDATLAAMCEIPTLSKIQIVSAKLTDRGVAPLEKLAGNLQWLILMNSPNLTDLALTHIDALPRLTYLNLQGAHVTDVGISGLSRLLDFTDLDLSASGVGGRTLAKLSGSQVLRVLYLDGAEINDADLNYLVGIKTLSMLRVWNTPLTDAAVPHLKRIANLKTLYIGGTRLTRAGVDELRAALPGCAIHSDFGSIEPGAEAPPADSSDE